MGRPSSPVDPGQEESRSERAGAWSRDHGAYSRARLQVFILSGRAMWPAGVLASPTGDRTCASCVGVLTLDCQGSPDFRP